MEIKNKIQAYLIQRAVFLDRSEKQGIDSIIKFDYMGSSEFEWGALPESLGRIRGNIDNYTYLHLSVKGKWVTVFTTRKYSTHEIYQYLDKLAKDEFHLKEYSDFNNFILHPNRCKTNFWWDIENDIMFWNRNLDFYCKFQNVVKPN